jgi:hypothetical protein
VLSSGTRSMGFLVEICCMTNLHQIDFTARMNDSFSFSGNAWNRLTMAQR